MIIMMKAQKAVLSLFQKEAIIENAKEFLENFSDDKYRPLNVGTPLKHSMYNIIKHKGRTYLIYNTLFNSMMTLSDSEFEQYQNIHFEALSLVEHFTDNGFIVSECVDEYHHYASYKKILNGMYSSGSHYTIVLTSKCNARCVYCYEEGVEQKDMSPAAAERIAELMCRSEKPVDITWFGGEPLLKTDIIDMITAKLNENGKAFTSGIITNGSLINENIVRNKFKEWCVEWVQITLDGMNEEYARMKCYIDRETDMFSRVISNIELIVKNDTEVSIRLNMDSVNSDECVKAAEYIREKFPDRDNISVYPAFLTGSVNNFENENKRIRYSELVYKYYSPGRNILSDIPKLNSCYFQQHGAFVIDTDGSILCCERDVGRHKTKIMSVYDTDSFDTLEKPEKLFPETRAQCKKCVYYPKCLGGCIAAYGCGYKYDACFMEKYKLEFILNKIMGLDSEE